MSDGGCPYSGQGPSDGKPNVYGKSDLTYNTYLKVSELTGLQFPVSDPAHHDEMLFIIIHQAYELWFKLIKHELATAMDHMREREVLRAQHFVKRTVEIMKVLDQQIHILETMNPVEFLEFRSGLNPASGFQSLQFREIEFMAGLKDESYLKHFEKRPEMLRELRAALAAPDLNARYLEMVNALGYTLPTRDAPETRPAILAALKPIYQDPGKDLPLYLLSESLVDLDQHLSLWREHHVRVVERVIGFKQGTGGSSGVEYLRTTTAKKAFPYLWEVRTLLEVRK